MTITADFETFSSTQALTNADSLPTGKLVINGTDNAAVVTVTNKATGIYKASVTLPTLSVGDTLQIRIAATIGGTSSGGIIWTYSNITGSTTTITEQDIVIR